MYGSMGTIDATYVIQVKSLSFHILIDNKIGQSGCTIPQSDRIYFQIEFVCQTAYPVYMLTQECLVSHSTGYVCHQVYYLHTLR